MKKLILACLLVIPCGRAGAAEPAPTGPEMQQLILFPDKPGQKNPYVTFYASREHAKRKLIEKTYWDEVVEAVTIHDFRVVVVRSSTGTLRQEKGKWIYGDPETTLNESVYVINSRGVALYSVYTAASGTDADYKTRRSEIIESLSVSTKEEIIEEMQNWILPFPVKAGYRRDWAVDENSYYKILRGGDKRFVNKAFRKTAFGVSGFIGGKWGMTRWFVPGKGLVLFETYNNDEGVDTKKFPYKAKALAVYSGR